MDSCFNKINCKHNLLQILNLTISSSNVWSNDCLFRDAYLAIMCNSITSFLSGFVIFTVLGYMSHVSGRQIQHVATEGPGLVFIVYPAAIAAMPGSVFWALIFFMMLLNLGLDSSVCIIPVLVIRIFLLVFNNFVDTNFILSLF